MNSRFSYPINDHWNGYLPVDIESMVQSLWTIQTHERSDVLLTAEHIYLPIAWQKTRQRYALAYAVHAYQYYKKDPLTFSVHDFTIHDSRSQLLNYRTLDTLIPQHILAFAITHKKVMTLEALASLFGTSKAAIVTQCKRAEIIS